MISHAGSYHGEILILLQYKRLVTCNEMCVVGTEVVKQTFDPEAELGSHFVFYATANHEPGFMIPSAKTKRAIVGGGHDEILVDVDEGNTACAVKQPIA